MTATPEIEHGTSLWRDAWHRLSRNKLAIFGLITFLLIALFCLMGPFFVSYKFDEQARTLQSSRPNEPILARTLTKNKSKEPRTDYIPLSKLADENAFLSLSPEEIQRNLAQVQRGEPLQAGRYTYQPTARRHLLGTDALGRDLLVRIMHGGRISIGVGLAATAVSILIGVVYGAISGYLGGNIDTAMMRFVDILYTIPFTIFVILLMVFLPRSIWLLFVAIGAVEWLTMARIIRGEIAALRNREFIEAAVSLGLGKIHIIFRHLIPNVMGSVIVYSTLTVPSVMLLEAVLSFLGLGVPPPMSSWGVLIDDGAKTLETTPWLLLFPAGIFSLTLFSLNFLGDGLRDALDPRASKD
ncbi:MAG TPA: ABC transporter permease subunit [Chthoniobacterales bacterium]|jgi:oligopeptide transport system permease protein